MGNAPLVNLLVAGGANRPRCAPGFEFVEDGFALVFGQHFGVGHAFRHFQMRRFLRASLRSSSRPVYVTRPNRSRTNHYRPCERSTPHFVKADDHIVALFSNSTFQIQCGNYGNRHQSAEPPSGTSANTSWCASSPPMRFNGQYFASPTPTTSEIGTSPCEESP